MRQPEIAQSNRPMMKHGFDDSGKGRAGGGTTLSSEAGPSTMADRGEVSVSMDAEH